MIARSKFYLTILLSGLVLIICTLVLGQDIARGSEERLKDAGLELYINSVNKKVLVYESVNNSSYLKKELLKVVAAIGEQRGSLELLLQEVEELKVAQKTNIVEEDVVEEVEAVKEGCPHLFFAKLTPY